MKARHKSRRTKQPSPKRKRVEIGSGNVFADLGFEDSEERLLKAELASKIAESIKDQGWTQAQTAKQTDLDQPKVARILRGRLSGFSADDLFGILNRLKHSLANT